MKLAVFGSTGMLGSDLVPLLEASGHDVTGFDRPGFDLTDAADLRQALRGQDAVINCAAYTDVDGAETEAELAYAVNAEAVGRLGELAAANRQYVLHVSTDFVYDGRQERPYTEADSPHPLNVYGASKWRGEQALAASGAAYGILRVEWTYGQHGRHFITKLRELAERRLKLQVVADQVGSPTATTRVAEVLRQLVVGQVPGTFLFAAAGYASRYDVACFAAEQLGLAVEITPCPSSTFPMVAARPLNSCFNCAKLEETLGLSRRPWQEDLTAYLELSP